MITYATQGASCLGTIIYLSRDKRTLEQRERGETLLSAERVAWIHTENLLGIENPELAGRLMDETAFYSRCKKHCYHLSVNWHPDQPEPSKAHMIEQGQAIMRVLQVEEHQVTMVAHTDTAHPHMHLVINRVHPEKLIAANMYQDRVKLSAWALKYEREHGRIVCIQREARAQAREAALARGEQPKDTRYVDNTLAECWTKSGNGKSFKAALEAKGWGLAKGDRKDDVLMVVTKSGRAFAIKRELNKGLPKGQKLTGADIDRKVSDLDRSTIKSVAEVQREIEASRRGRSGERSQGQAQPRPKNKREPAPKQKAREEAKEAEQARVESVKAEAEQAQQRAYREVLARQRAARNDNEKMQSEPANVRRADLQDRQIAEQRELSRRHDLARERKEAELERFYGEDLAKQKTLLAALADRARQKEGLAGVLYRLSGQAEADRQTVKATEQSISNAQMRIGEHSGAS